MKDEVVEWEVNWEWLYGELPVGKYRIGKQIMDWRAPGDYDTVLYYAEFELRDQNNGNFKEYKGENSYGKRYKTI